MVRFTEDDYAALRERNRQRLSQGPRAVAAWYEPSTERLCILLASGVTLQVPIALIRGLTGATPTQIARVEVMAPGLTLEWPELETGLSLDALVADLLTLPSAPA